MLIPKVPKEELTEANPAAPQPDILKRDNDWEEAVKIRLRKRNPFWDCPKRSSILTTKASTTEATQTSSVRFSLSLCLPMRLTASEIASLSSRLDCWEIAEYLFSGLVAIGCAGEYIADLTTWFTRAIRKKVGRISTLLLIAALAGELVCLIETNNLSARLLGSVDDLAQDAAGKSETAVTKSGTALANSGQAVTKAGEAKEVSEKAALAATGASKDAATAKTQAKDILKRLDTASTKLDKVEGRLKLEGPRIDLFTTDNWADGTDGEQNTFLKLRPFAGQKILFRTGYSDIKDPAELHEAKEFASHLMYLIGPYVAGWNVAQREQYKGWGVEILYCSDASPRTKEAAKALGKWVKAHGITTMQRTQKNLLLEIDPNFF